MPASSETGQCVDCGCLISSGAHSAADSRLRCKQCRAWRRWSHLAEASGIAPPPHPEKQRITEEGAWCLECLRWLAHSDFGINKTRIHAPSKGLSNRCLDCARQMRTDRPSTKELKGRQKPYRQRMSKRITAEGVWCAACKKRLPIENFGLSKADPNGLQTYCRPCRNTYSRRRRREFRLQAGLPPIGRITERTTSEGVWCPHCQRRLPPSSFRPAKGRKSGLASYCDPCLIKDRKAYQPRRNELARKRRRNAAAKRKA